MTGCKAFFGDCERNFALAPEGIRELERLAGCGIGSLCKRLFSGDFRHSEIVDTIRLALIGGGAPPEIAANLTATYAAPRPFNETYPVAVAILEALYFGNAVSGGTDAQA